MKQPKAKKILDDYNKKLEELRSTLMATKHKSIFADEKKLRENLSEVYAAVCFQECKPSNLQTGRTAVLQGNLTKAEQSYTELVNANSQKVAETIAAEEKREKNTPRSSN